jgi:hypothetical protein
MSEIYDDYEIKTVIKDLYTNLNKQGDEIFVLKIENAQLRARICKLEGDGR